MKKSLTDHPGIFILTFLFVFNFNFISISKTWNVGPSRSYLVPSAVVGLVNNGDTVEIDAGLYSGDVATWTKNDLVLKGIGGMAHLDANGKSAGGKAIWVIDGTNTTIEYIEFSGCTVVDQNGAGIRPEAVGLTIRHCYFHNNDDGILGGTTGSILIEYSEFAYNGFGDGYSHNIYISHIDKFTLQYCYIHDAKIGHEVKSRAQKNYILYNRITNESDGTASRNIDLPNGGQAIIIGNLIQKGPNTQNNNFIEFGLEGLINNPPFNIYIVNNTFVNERGANGLFIDVAANTNLLKAYNNIFTGAPYTFLSGTPVTLDTSSDMMIPSENNAGFVNVTGYDYNLVSTSPAINKGTGPGSYDSFSLTPIFQYVHPENSSARIQYGPVDIGAYEIKPATVVQNEKSEQIRFINDGYGKIKIIYPGNNPNSVIMIYDIEGKFVGIASKISTNIYEWNYDKSAKGIYLLKLYSGMNEVVKKILINSDL